MTQITEADRAVFLPSADNVPCGENKAERTHWAYFLSGEQWSYKLPKPGKKTGSNLNARYIAQQLQHDQRRRNRGVMAPLALLLGFIACARPNSNSPEEKQSQSASKNACRALLLQRLQPTPAERDTPTSGHLPVARAALGSMLCALGTLSCSMHTPPGCSAPVSGHSSRRMVECRLLPSSCVLICY